MIVICDLAGGFSLSAGEFGAAPPEATRRLEFIGDSDTAGWCADGSPSTNDKADKYQDGYQTWAMQIARNVSADMMVEAVSGYGVEVSTPAIQVLAGPTAERSGAQHSTASMGISVTLAPP